MISSVAWVALDEDLGFQHREDEEPQFVLLEPFEPQRSDDRVSGVRTWPLLDRKAVRRKGPRGLLIMCCLVGEVPVYFVEVERRPDKKENFSGMAFRLRPNASLDGGYISSCPKFVMFGRLFEAASGVSRSGGGFYSSFASAGYDSV